MSLPHDERSKLVASVDHFIHGRVRRRVIGVLGKSHFQDAVQEARMRAWRVSAYWRPDGGASFFTYVRRAILGEIENYIDRVRNHDRRVKFMNPRDGFSDWADGGEIGSASEEWVDGAFLPESRYPAPHEGIEREETVAVVREALGKMADGVGRDEGYKGGHRKSLLELRFGMVDGHRYTLTDVGQILGISKGRAQQLERAAIEDLSDFLNKESVV